MSPESNRAADYRPMKEGLAPQAQQRVRTIASPAGCYDVGTIAEAVFTATKAPYEIVVADPIPTHMAEFLVDAIADGAGVRSLSVGDISRVATGMDRGWWSRAKHEAGCGGSDERPTPDGRGLRVDQDASSPPGSPARSVSRSRSARRPVGGWLSSGHRRCPRSPTSQPPSGCQARGGLRCQRART